MIQQDLFPEANGLAGIPIAANADPATSHEAARLMDGTGARGRHCRIVLALVREHPGSTAVELWSVQDGLERHEISRRLADLKNAGAVRQGEARLCRVRGTKMVTWEITEHQPCVEGSGHA